MRKNWTTFTELKAAGACQPRYRHLAKALGGVKVYGNDTPIPLLKILETNGEDDVEWALMEVESLSPLYYDYQAKRIVMSDDHCAYKLLWKDYKAKTKAALIEVIS